MSQVSTARKLNIIARLAAQRATRTRTFGAVLKGAQTTLSHFGRVLHTLWLEMTGFVFLALAVIGGAAFFREYAKYRAAQAPLARVLLAVAFTLVFAYFGISSFWRARRRN
jgi:hypothetical protein